MRIQLSDHFTYKRLLRFVIPSIVMMICTSVYSIVDGLFVSNFVGKTPFAAGKLVFSLFLGQPPHMPADSGIFMEKPMIMVQRATPIMVQGLRLGHV